MTKPPPTAAGPTNGVDPPRSSAKQAQQCASLEGLHQQCELGQGPAVTMRRDSTWTTQTARDLGPDSHGPSTETRRHGPDHALIMYLRAMQSQNRP